MEFYCGFLSSWSWHNGYLAECFKPTRNLLLSNEQIKPVSSTLNQIDPLRGILRKEWEDPIHPSMSGSLCGRTGSFSEDKITGDKQLLPDMDFRLETSRALLSIGLRSSRLYGWGEEKEEEWRAFAVFLTKVSRGVHLHWYYPKGARDQQNWAATATRQKKGIPAQGPKISQPLLVQ